MTHLLSAFGLRKSFVTARSLLGRPTQVVQAVRGVGLHLNRGETLALVGESGSGKSTTGRLLLRLIEPDEGSVHFAGQELTTMDGRALRAIRRQMQMVFQDPVGSLDPTWTIGQSLAEPIVVHEGRGAADDHRRLVAALERVGLGERHLDVFPHELSGGQRQRVSIARAMIGEPDLVVCDEVVSALDVATQAQVLNLLKDLQRDTGVAYLFITHDLSVIPSLAHRVAVMHLGEIVEHGPVERVFNNPGHPYTEALMSAVPIADPRRQRARQRITLHGEIPSPNDPPPGCAFHPRCHEGVIAQCRTVSPRLRPVEQQVAVACHLRGSDSPAVRHDSIIDPEGTRS